MARGSEGKAKRKDARKEAREVESKRSADLGIEHDFGEKGGEKVKTSGKKKNDEKRNNTSDSDSDSDSDSGEGEIPFPSPPGKSQSGANNGDEDATNDEKTTNDGKTTRRSRRRAPPPTDSCCGGGSCSAPSGKGGIKTLPLVMLIMLTGTTVLPALLFAGDWFGAYLSQNNILGSLGHRFGVGPNPKKRVESFYEKHDPVKVEEVSNIMAKYYGDYGTLTKRLERKYGDYGYFIGWEEDEAPRTLALEKIRETRDALGKLFDANAPRLVRVGARNMRHNVNRLYRKGRVIWRKKVWPLLEPFLGVPDGGKAQKRKDRSEASKRQGSGGGRKKGKANTEFRDEDEF